MVLTENKQLTPEGYISMYLHKGGEFINGKLVDGQIVEHHEVHNLIVDSASKLMAGRMAPGAITGAGSASFQGSFLDHGLTHLAIGHGPLTYPDLPYDETNNPIVADWDKQNPPKETLTDTKLSGEGFRKQFTSWCFLDSVGNETNELTNILKLSTTFYENEGNFPITECGLFGGDASDWNSAQGKDSGVMFNLKRFPVINKQSAYRLTLVWKLTF